MPFPGGEAAKNSHAGGTAVLNEQNIMHLSCFVSVPCQAFAHPSPRHRLDSDKTTTSRCFRASPTLIS